MNIVQLEVIEIPHGNLGLTYTLTFTKYRNARGVWFDLSTTCCGGRVFDARYDKMFDNDLEFTAAIGRYRKKAI